MFQMERPKRKLTTCEEIALFYHIFADEKNWNILYESAIGSERYNKLKDNSKQKAVSNWKHSPRVTERVKQLIYEKQRREEELKEEIRSKTLQEIENGETESTKGTAKNQNTIQTDFLNRDEFLKFLNMRANQITDDKLRNDILKMLSDNMRYKESESEESTEIQRFYTPITCESCDIYKKCKSCKVENCPRML